MSNGTPSPVTAIPGAVVPGMTPGTTPPILQGGGTPDPSSQVSEMTKRLLQTLAQASQRKQFAGTPVPGAVPERQDPRAGQNIGMNTTHPNAWGKQRFAAGIQAMISNAVADQKQKKLVKAEADWTYLQSALNEKYSAEASGDPKAIAAAQQKVDVVLSDPKKLKDLAKALNQDWLAPEKTTVYGEALKKVTAKAGQEAQTDAQKQQAAQGLRGVMQKLLQRQQQPQLSPEQRSAMAREIEAKAPTQIVQDPKLLQYMETQQGKLEIEQMKEKATKEVEAMKEQARKDLQKPVDKVLDEAKAALAAGDQKGYAAKLKEAGELAATTKSSKTPNEIELIQRTNAGDKEAAATLKNLRDSRLELAKERGLSSQGAKPMTFFDPDLKREVVMSAAEAEAQMKSGKNLVPSGTVPANTLIQVQRAANAIPSAVAEVEKHLGSWDNAADRAIFAKIIKENAAGSEDAATWFGNILTQASTESLSEEGRAALTSLRRLNESMGSLRAISGLPSTVGSMMATAALLPGAGTPDSKMARDQLEQVKLLVQQETGVELLGGKKPPADSANSNKEGMEVRTYNGATYQRKKGTKDQWTLAP
jgi:hypothetical protein